MSSRSDKQTKLKNNVDASAERATRCECRKLGINRMSKQANELHRKYQKEFQQSALRVENKLHEVWND